MSPETTQTQGPVEARFTRRTLFKAGGAALGASLLTPFANRFRDTTSAAAQGQADQPTTPNQPHEASLDTLKAPDINSEDWYTVRYHGEPVPFEIACPNTWGFDSEIKEDGGKIIKLFSLEPNPDGTIDALNIDAHPITDPTDPTQSLDGYKDTLITKLEQELGKNGVPADAMFVGQTTLNGIDVYEIETKYCDETTTPSIVYEMRRELFQTRGQNWDLTFLTSPDMQLFEDRFDKFYNMLFSLFDSLQAQQNAQLSLPLANVFVITIEQKK